MFSSFFSVEKEKTLFSPWKRGYLCSFWSVPLFCSLACLTSPSLFFFFFCLSLSLSLSLYIYISLSLSLSLIFLAFFLPSFLSCFLSFLVIFPFFCFSFLPRFFAFVSCKEEHQYSYILKVVLINICFVSWCHVLVVSFKSPVLIFASPLASPHLNLPLFGVCVCVVCVCVFFFLCWFCVSCFCFVFGFAQNARKRAS